MRLAPVLTVVLAAVAVPTLAACGSSSDSSTSSTPASTPAAATAPAATTPTPTTAVAADPAGSTVDVQESEWKIAPSAATVKAGKVTFAAKDVGSAPHELVVIKTDKPADGLGTGSNVSEKGSVGEIEDLSPGASKSKTFNLKPGKYVLICNLPGHYMQGMHTAFTVS